MPVASCLHVSRNELTPGGTVAAISAIKLSGIGPGPLGISDTNPIADAPASIAIHASSMLAIQQIFTRGLVVGFIFSEQPLCTLCLCGFSGSKSTTETQSPQRWHREEVKLQATLSNLTAS